MNAVSIGEYHGLRVGSALLSIVAGCIIIGVSKDCDADAVGGIFLGAGGLGLLISVYPFIKAWLNFHHILPNIGVLVPSPSFIHAEGENSMTHGLSVFSIYLLPLSTCQIENHNNKSQ
uniref:Kinocilin n=1 Tax=Electrophorus electricus TaxID=8005 RepID=A0A4W4FSL7_ELEEL